MGSVTRVGVVSMLAGAVVIPVGACSGEAGGESGWADDAGVDSATDGSVSQPDAWSTPSDAAPEASQPPDAVEPCAEGSCWTGPSLASACGTATVNEDFSSGLYNVHRYPLAAPANVPLELTVQVTAGGVQPALILHDAEGATLHDGKVSWSTPGLTVQGLATGEGSDLARLRVVSTTTEQLSLFVTGWDVIASGFSVDLPAGTQYTLTNLAECEPPPGGLLSPPNFDPDDVENGFYLMPQSEPPGLYTRKANDCSRGTKLLIDVLYTAAVHWKTLRPALSPLAFADLNKGSCSTVNHATHDDGTHADVVAGCATQIACSDKQPAIDLAKLFVDTGEVCGILFNDTQVQDAVNAYFASKYAYPPWNGKFMRTVSGHTHHFHVRVKKPDGTCN